MRQEIVELVKLGPLPSSQAASVELVDRYEQLIRAIQAPVTDDEARALVKLFGPDDCYGMAWSVLHLIETAPNWPLLDCFENIENEWVRLLRDSARRAGMLPPKS